MQIPYIRCLILAVLPGFWLASPVVGALQTAPQGFYSIELKPGDQAVGVSLVNPALFNGTVAGSAGNRLTLAAPAPDAGSLLTAGKACYVELVAGPSGPLDGMVGHRFEVDVAATLAGPGGAGELVLDLNSRHSTLAVLPPLAGYAMELREHLTLDQVFPKERLHGSTNFAEADQVQFFNGKGFEICYVYRRGGGQSQWTGQKVFASQDARVLPPGEGFIFRRSAKGPGPVTLLVSGVARTTPFVQPLAPGNNLVSGGYPVDNSFADRKAWPSGYQDGDRVKAYQSAGFVTYRLYSAGTSIADNRWVALGDRNFTSVNHVPVFDYRRAAFLQLEVGDPAHRYFPSFQP